MPASSSYSVVRLSIQKRMALRTSGDSGPWMYEWPLRSRCFRVRKKTPSERLHLLVDQLHIAATPPEAAGRGCWGQGSWPVVAPPHPRRVELVADVAEALHLDGAYYS